jgi:thioredoxin-related protein
MNLRKILVLSFLALLFFLTFHGCHENNYEGTSDDLELSKYGKNIIEENWSFSKEKYPLILSFINPDCEHCQYETQALLRDHDDKPANLRLAFLSDVHIDSLKAFANQFKYDTTSTVFLWDEESKIAQQMGVTSYPTMFLYDTSGVHLQTIVGEAKPSYVYKFFHETH